MNPMDENASAVPVPGPESPADGKFHHFDPNAIPVGRIGMAISSLIFIAVALVGILFLVLIGRIGWTVTLAILGVWVALFPALGIYSWVWPAISYRHAHYCLKEDCIVVRRGVFWKTETLVPKSRIQHTDIVQGPLQRSYEISDLVIHTAGTRFALVPVSSLPQETAPRLRNFLLDRTDDDHL